MVRRTNICYHLHDINSLTQIISDWNGLLSTLYLTAREAHWVAFISVLCLNRAVEKQLKESKQYFTIDIKNQRQTIIKSGSYGLRSRSRWLIFAVNIFDRSTKNGDNMT